jgi:Tol biopolymer transport system component
VWRGSPGIAGCCPSWAPDGNTLYFARGAAPGAQRGVLQAARIRRGPVPVVLSVDSLFTSADGTPPPYPGSASIHPDGDRWLMRREMGPVGGDAEAEAPERPILVRNWFEELRERVGR